MSQISIDRVHATAKKHKKIVILTRHTLFTHKSSRIIRKTGATGRPMLRASNLSLMGMVFKRLD